LNGGFIDVNALRKKHAGAVKKGVKIFGAAEAYGAFALFRFALFVSNGVSVFIGFHVVKIAVKYLGGGEASAVADVEKNDIGSRFQMPIDIILNDAGASFLRETAFFFPKNSKKKPVRRDIYRNRVSAFFVFLEHGKALLICSMGMITPFFALVKPFLAQRIDSARVLW
jgi:hypothetical protein